MQRKWLLVLAASLLVLLVAAPAARVASAAGTCPDNFHLHTMDDMHEPGHMHVGLSMEAVDRNGNGLICVKHVTPDGSIHVHIDDFIP